MVTNQYSVYKAQKTGDREIDSAVITIDVEIPEATDKNSLIDWESQANQQAELLERILIDTLPGGVYDRLFARMAERKASLFKVPLLL